MTIYFPLRPSLRSHALWVSSFGRRMRGAGRVGLALGAVDAHRGGGTGVRAGAYCWLGESISLGVVDAPANGALGKRFLRHWAGVGTGKEGLGSVVSGTSVLPSWRIVCGAYAVMYGHACMRVAVCTVHRTSGQTRCCRIESGSLYADMLSRCRRCSRSLPNRGRWALGWGVTSHVPMRRKSVSGG